MRDSIKWQDSVSESGEENEILDLSAILDTKTPNDMRSANKAFEKSRRAKNRPSDVHAFVNSTFNVRPVNAFDFNDAQNIVPVLSGAGLIGTFTYTYTVPLGYVAIVNKLSYIMNQVNDITTVTTLTITAKINNITLPVFSGNGFNPQNLDSQGLGTAYRPETNIATYFVANQNDNISIIMVKNNGQAISTNPSKIMLSGTLLMRRGLPPHLEPANIIRKKKR